MSSNTINRETLPLALTYEQAAEQLGISRAFVFRLVARGEVRAISLGRARRIPRSEVERLLAGDVVVGRTGRAPGRAAGR